jgi:hypothetical protein
METQGIEPGQCFITVDLLTDINSVIPMRLFISHGLTSSAPVSYPESAIIDSTSTESTGTEVRFDDTWGNPKYAHDGFFSFWVPDHFVIKLESLLVQYKPLIADPTDSGIELSISYGQGVPYKYVLGLNRNLAASIQNLWNINFSPNAGNPSAQYDEKGTIFYDSIMIPDLLLIPGDTLLLKCNNIDPSSAIILSYKQWLSPLVGPIT